MVLAKCLMKLLSECQQVLQFSEAQLEDILPRWLLTGLLVQYLISLSGGPLHRLVNILTTSQLASPKAGNQGGIVRQMAHCDLASGVSHRAIPIQYGRGLHTIVNNKRFRAVFKAGCPTLTCLEFSSREYSFRYTLDKRTGSHPLSRKLILPLSIHLTEVCPWSSQGGMGHPPCQSDHLNQFW